MKYFSKIFTFVFVLVTLCGCEQKSLVGGGTTGGEEDDIFMPTDGYIFFNVKHPKTRGELIEGALPYNFNVIGYNYSSAWNTVRVQAKQTKEVYYTLNGTAQTPEMGVFYSAAQSNGIQLIEYDDSYHSYNYKDGSTNDNGEFIGVGLKPWIAELKHAFFAWYPANHANVGFNDLDVINNQSVAPQNVEGEPYISYTLPTGTNKVAREAMIDVMTACEIDQTKYNVENNGGSINFSMKHRLAALDIVGTSIITAKSIKETWGQAAQEALEKGETFTDKNNVTIDVASINNDAEVKVKSITPITLNLNSIKSKAKIYLNTINPNDELTQTEAIGNPLTNITYTGFESDAVVLNYYSSEDEAKPLVGEKEKLILIPQAEELVATLTLSYIVECTNKNGVTYEVQYTPETPLTSTLNGLQEGHYHYLLLTFTASGVYVKAQVEESWDLHRVEYEFD